MALAPAKAKRRQRITSRLALRAPLLFTSSSPSLLCVPRTHGMLSLSLKQRVPGPEKLWVSEMFGARGRFGRRLSAQD